MPLNDERTRKTQEDKIRCIITEKSERDVRARQVAVQRTSILQSQRTTESARTWRDQLRQHIQRRAKQLDVGSIN